MALEMGTVSQKQKKKMSGKALIFLALVIGIPVGIFIMFAPDIFAGSGSGVFGTGQRVGSFDSFAQVTRSDTLTDSFAAGSVSVAFYLILDSEAELEAKIGDLYQDNGTAWIVHCDHKVGDSPSYSMQAIFKSGTSWYVTRDVLYSQTIVSGGKSSWAENEGVLYVQVLEGLRDYLAIHPPALV